MQLLAIKAGSKGMCSPVDEGWAPVKGGAASRRRVYKGGRGLLGVLFCFFSIFSCKLLSNYYYHYICCSKLHLASFPSYRAYSKLSCLGFYLLLRLVPLSFRVYPPSFALVQASQLKHPSLPSCLPLQPTASPRFPPCLSVCPANPHTTLLRPARRLTAASPCLLPKPAQA